MVAERENSALAARLIEQSCLKQCIVPQVLTLHSDHGAPMTSKCTAQLLADLGVTRSLSRRRQVGSNCRDHQRTRFEPANCIAATSAINKLISSTRVPPARETATTRSIDSVPPNGRTTNDRLPAGAGPYPQDVRCAALASDTNPLQRCAGRIPVNLTPNGRPATFIGAGASVGGDRPEHRDRMTQPIGSSIGSTRCLRRT